MTTILLFALAVTAACGADDTAETEPTGPSTTADATTTAPTVTTVPATSSTTTPATTAPTADLELARCRSTEGYSIGYPASWSTNSGEVVAACSLFHQEPFEVPDATDERVAAISAYVDPVLFAAAAAPDEDRNAERAVTAIDGLQALRLEYDADGLWPEGTPITVYAVDVSTEDQDQTLFLDTVGLPGFDYAANQTVLDRMARTIDVDMEGVTGSADIVANYQGAGNDFAVEAHAAGSEACVATSSDGGEICTDLPAPDQLHTIQLETPEPVIAGVTGSDVFAVTAEQADGGDTTVLPAPIEGSDAGAFSFTFGLGEIQRLILTDIRGEDLRTIEPGG